MARNLKIVPAAVCCPQCVTDALAQASVDLDNPFVIYSGLRSLPPSARRQLVEQLIAHAEGDVALIVSTPLPAAEAEAATPIAAEAESPDAAAPTPAELSDLLGLNDAVGEA